MTQPFLLRNVYNEKEVKNFAAHIHSVYSDFDIDAFLAEIMKDLDDKSFGDRIALICEKLKKFLPKDFEKSANILISALEPELEKKNIDGMQGFMIIPQTMFIRKYGLEHFDISMKALYEMTKRFSSEGSIRYFILKYPQKTYSFFEKWAKDDSVHVRRLVSECTRPRLPLCIRLAEFQKDPAPVIHLLEKLKTDPELYVRRSVANNLNDISKDNPDMMLKVLREWKKIKNSGTQWIIRHALRTLLKQGNTGALELLGYPRAQLQVNNLQFPKKVSIGKRIQFQFDIFSQSSKSQKLMIDYDIHYMKANGKLRSKTFKCAKKTLKAGEGITLSQKHSFKQMSTRKHYAGKHAIEIKVNGQLFGQYFFLLEK